MASEPESEGLSVVLRGNFNPGLITPAWLARKKLIGEQESETELKEQTIVQGASIFALSWLRVEVTPDRLALHGADPLEFERVRDVAVGILTALPETPILLLGLNRHFHYRSESIGSWHKSGDVLVPKETFDGVLNLPGLRTVTVEGVREDDFLGYVRVRIEPSAEIQPGLFIEVNDHYILEERQDVRIGSREDFFNPAISEALDQMTASADRGALALKILSQNWHASNEHSKHIADVLRSRLAHV